MEKVITVDIADKNDLVEKYDITILPLHILLGEEEFLDGVTITPEEIYKTLQFMEEIRDTNNNRLLPSGDVLDVMQQAERLKIPMEKLKDNIDLFVQHLYDLENVQPTKGGRTFSSRRLNALIKKWT